MHNRPRLSAGTSIALDATLEALAAHLTALWPSPLRSPSRPARMTLRIVKSRRNERVRCQSPDLGHDAFASSPSAYSTLAITRRHGFAAYQFRFVLCA